MSNFRNAKPRRMNGMASMMAQARNLPSVAQQRQKVANGIMHNAAGVGAAEQEAMQALHELLGRLNTAEHRVQLVTDVIAKFKQQCTQLEADDPVRQTAEKMLATFLDCCKAGLNVQLQEEQHEADAGSTGPG